MTENRIVKSRYIYIHEAGKWPSQTIDIHHVISKQNRLWTILVCISALVLLLNASYFLQTQDILISVILLYLMIGVIFVKLLRQKIVEKESVVIIPAFGLQFETHYKSGRAVRHFVPIDKILKPILNECVTPVTCYWSLALLLREEDELMLVFKAIICEFDPSFAIRIATPIQDAATNLEGALCCYAFQKH
ncbi:Phosphatidylinositol N-acetylglucosaminyltransferase subunit H [Bienertia sinuspersici]